MNQTFIEDKIRAWVLPASGLDAAHVIFTDQPLPSPAPAAMIAIRLGELIPMGAVDPETWAYNAAAPLGEEIEFETRGWRKMNCELTAIAPAVTGASTARELLAKCVAALSLSEVRYALTTIGSSAALGVANVGPVHWIPKEIGDRREGTAVVEVSFTVRETAAAKLGYIEKVKGTITVSEGSHEASIPFEKTIV